jgi:NADH-quinone oxidoreductase subunit N
MTFITPVFSVALPDIFVLSMAALILLVDVFLPDRHRVLTYVLVQFTLVVTFMITISQYNNYPSPIITFSNNYIIDKLSIILKMFICVVSFFVFAYSRAYVKARNIGFGEYFVLGLFCVLGMLIIASSYSFLMLYLGLELMSLSLYAMTAMDRDSKFATEAAMKFFIMGALASGLLLYGISLLYGATGSVDMLDISSILMNVSAQPMVVVAALVFILSGVLFKFGAFPFHMWVPDVYAGAPACMTLFISSAPKIAAFGILIRIVEEALPSFQLQWGNMLIVVAVLSMFFGNVLAIAQTDIKRMLAYSSIAHIGYMLLGVIAGPNSSEGYSAGMFYIATYVLVAAGAFAIITLLSKPGAEFDKLDDFRGLNARNPWLAFMMLLLMFSMAGVPPTVGFFAKLGLLESLVEAHLVWLAALGLLFSIIGAYYYLRVVMLMYFEEPKKSHAGKITLPWDMMIAISINGGAALVLGLLPSTFIDLCRISLA